MATCFRRPLIRFLPVAAGVLLLVQAACTETESIGEDQLSTGNEDQSSADNATPSTETPAPSGKLQSNEDAEAQDIALVAAARGWTIEEAAADHRAAEIVGSIAVQVAAERPEMFVGSVLSPEPGGASALYIKGPADDFVRSLVASAEIEIEIIDNQPFSREELDERQNQVARALEAMGFQNFAVGTNIRDEGQIEASVTREPGLPDDPDEILSSLPAGLRDGVTMTVSDDPVAVAQ